MRIISLNSKSQTLNSKQILNSNFPNHKPTKFGKLEIGIWDLFRISDFGFRIFTLFMICCLLIGCAKSNDLEKAQRYIRQSEAYYQQAITQYKNLVAQGKDLDKLYFQLGKLYLDHGDFELAIEVLRNSHDTKAKKFLAISYYRLGKFSDALEIFKKLEVSDDEYLYYQGLTLEKLNLFDKALESYKKIKDTAFATRARERMQLIEKEGNLVHIAGVDERVSQLLLNAPSAEEYPQAGALILFCDEKIEITPEGTQVSYLHYLIKILNERGKEEFSESHISYDSTYERVELEYARTLKPDGTIVDVGSRHIRDVSKYLNFPLYSNVRAYIISFPEITEGAVIEYKLKVYNSQLINNKDFVLNYPLQTNEPIIQAKFSLLVPKGDNLYLKNINTQFNDFGADLNPHREEKGGHLIYTWHFKNIPQIIPEANMPPRVEINPTLLISTFDNWQEVYNWWWALSKDKIEANKAIKDKVAELIKDLASEEDKARAIYNFCAQKIRYVAVEYGQAGYEPHQAEVIFRNKYGDCKDQAILLITMLKEAGLVARPVLIATKEYYNLNEDFPAVLFNHCIVALFLKDKIVFLDPTAQTCSFSDLPPDDQGRKVLIFKEDGFKIEETPAYPAERNLVKQYLKIRINNDEGILAEKSNFTSGFYDQVQRYWLLYTQPELIKKSLEAKIQEISIGARLNKYNIENLENLDHPVVLSYTFEGPEYFTVAGDLRLMPQLVGLDSSLVASQTRKYDLDFNVLDTKETIFEIEIPDSFVIKYIPKDISEDSPWLRFFARYEQRNNKIYFRQKTELKKKVIPEAEYGNFKNFFEGIAKKAKQRVVLERIR